MPDRLRQFYPGGDTAQVDPHVSLFEDFIAPAEAHALIGAARERLGRATVSADKSGVESPGRSGSNCWIAHDHDGLIAGLAGRLAELVGLPLANAESFQVVHYGPGQEYRPHYDAWDATTERGRRCMARGGQRLVTCLLYLNEVEAGGGTGFPHLELEVMPRKGRMVLFHNCHAGATERHPASLHGGMPVLAGEKWACNLWFRERRFQQRKPQTKREA